MNSNMLAFVPVKGHLLGIRDDIAALFNCEDDVKHARYRVRDEAHLVTWVNDRLMGLIPNGL